MRIFTIFHIKKIYIYIEFNYIKFFNVYVTFYNFEKKEYFSICYMTLKYLGKKNELRPMEKEASCFKVRQFKILTMFHLN